MFYKLALLLFMFPHLTYGLPCEKPFAKRNKYVSYQEARKYAIANRIRTRADWESREHPTHIPRDIAKYFQRQGEWTNWHDFLGKKRVSYEEARKYAITNRIRSRADWESRKHPTHIPRTVAKYFKKQGKWQGWHAFLGKKKMSYEEARQYAITNNIRSIADWKSRKHPVYIPTAVANYFRRQGKWQGWPAFLGRKRDGRQGTYNISYKQARQYAIDSQIKDAKDWNLRKHPAHIPRDIAAYFKKQGKWTSWYDFLGKKKKAGSKNVL